MDIKDNKVTLTLTLDLDQIKEIIADAVKEAMTPEEMVVDLSSESHPWEPPEGSLSQEDLRGLVREAYRIRTPKIGKEKSREEIVKILADSGAKSTSSLAKTDYEKVAGKIRALINGG